MAENSLIIGARLKTARRKQNIKVSRVVADLCISKRFIVAFEKNDMSQFPTNAYAVGFLKTYADYLGLDHGPLVKELKNHLQEEDFDFQPCRPLDQQSQSSWLVRGSIIGLIGLVVTGIYFGWTHLKDNDYKIAQDEEIPAHLVAFLTGGDEVQLASQLIIQNLGGLDAKVRVVALVDAEVEISDVSGNILHQGWLFSGSELNLPTGADLYMFTADFSALTFYLDEVLVTPDFINHGGAKEVALKSFRHAMDTIVPTG